MNTQLQKFLANAPHLYPHALERQFPRIVERIVAAWPAPEQAATVFDDLLIDRRSGRQGFPPEVARELLQLSVYYDSIHAKMKPVADVWEHERATASIEELGMRIVPADMLRAAKDGDPQRLALFLRAGMSVDARDARDWTPLMVAAFHGHEAAAKFLIENGANPRARDHAGYTPLHWAALRGYEEVVELIADRTDCNLQSTAGVTPLLQAAAAGHLAVVQLLLSAGADPNVSSREGWTPLHKAVANGHRAVARLLVASGASLFARHTDGTTPLALAAKRKDDFLQLLRRPAEGRPINAQVESPSEGLDA
jgi:hypothetical protein